MQTGKRSRGTQPKRMKLAGERLAGDNRLARDPRWVAFGVHVEDFMHQRGFSRATFVEALADGGYDITGDMLAKILTGQVKPPAGLITGLRKDTRRAKATLTKSWPEIFAMKPKEAAAFELRFWIAHSHERLAEMLECMKAEIEKCHGGLRKN